MSREKFFSEEVANVVWKIPGLVHSKKLNFQEYITRRDRRKIEEMEKQMLQRLQKLLGGQSTEDFGWVASCAGSLGGEDSKLRYLVITNGQRLEIEIVDSSGEGRIRRYRKAWGKFGAMGERKICLSALGEKVFSWRRDFSDCDYPEKGLTLRESLNFMTEILNACSGPSQSLTPTSEDLIL